MGTAILRFVTSSKPVEHGFLAAGVTITVVCIVQSIAIILGWFG